ncbi:MAG: HTTM domain-containing protein [Chthoniobacterales bacterium]
MTTAASLAQPITANRLGHIGSVARKFFLTPECAGSLAYLRIGLGVFLVVKSVILAGSLLQFYGMRGITQWSVSEAILDPSVIRLSWIAHWLQPIGIDDDQTVFLVFGVQALAAVGLIIGWQTRLMALLAWLSHFALENSAAVTSYGADQMAHVFLFYCVIMPVGHSVSVDSWRRKTPYPATVATRVVRRLIQFHLCIIYISSGLSKAFREQWWSGDAVWRLILEARFLRGFADVSWLASLPWLVAGVSWMILFLEIGYPVFVWPHRTRNWWLAAVIVMHLATGVMMGLVLFAWVMIVANVAAFAPRREVEGAP